MLGSQFERRRIGSIEVLDLLVHPVKLPERVASFEK